MSFATRTGSNTATNRNPVLTNVPSRVLGLVAGITLAVGVSGALAQQGMPTLNLDDLSPDASVVAQVYQADQIKPTLRGVKKVAVSSFALESVLKTGRGIQSGNTSLEVTYVLAEVPQAAVQAALNKAYNDFVGDLKAAGFEVVPHEQVVATNAFKASKQAASAPASGPRRLEQGDFAVDLYTPQGLNTVSESRWMYMSNLSSAGGAGILGAFRAVSNIAGGVADGSLQADMAKELGVPVIAVVLPLEFVTQTSSSSRTQVSMSSELRLSISPMAYVGVATPAGDFTAVPHRAYVAMGGTPVREVKDTSSVGANVALGALNALVGQGRSKRMVEKTALAHQDQFPQSVSDGLAKFRPILGQVVSALSK